jgi:hypothetical protein
MSNIKIFPLQTMAMNAIKDKDSIQSYKYFVEGKKYLIIDSSSHKICIGEDYNFIFSKKDGNFMRWGKTYEEDPNFSPIGPEILDLEISINGCPNGCKFCSPAGVKVDTDNGKVPIEDVRVGDKVWGLDEDGLSRQTVKEIYQREYNGEMIDMQLENDNILSVTSDHIIILNGNIEKKAGDLTENDEIIGIMDVQTKGDSKCPKKILNK